MKECSPHGEKGTRMCKTVPVVREDLVGDSDDRQVMIVRVGDRYDARHGHILPTHVLEVQI